MSEDGADATIRPPDGSEPAGGGAGVLRSLAASIAALLASNVINRATSFVVYALVAGFLGARELGQLALAMSLFYLANRFALLGLDTLTTRDIAKDRTLTGRYLGTAGVLVAGASLLTLPLIWGFAALVGYPESTVRVVVLLFLGMVPFTLSQLTEATFIAWGRARYVAYSNSPVWILQTGLVLVLLRAGRSVDAVALSIAAAHAAIALVHWMLAVLRLPDNRIRADVVLGRQLVAKGAPFVGIQGINALRTNVGIIILSALADEAAVGIFAAANQLLVPAHLIFHATGSAAFPAMVEHFRSGVSSLQTLSRRLVDFTLAVAIPATTGLILLAGPVLLLVYRDSDFLDSVPVLRILAWNVVGMALTAVLGQVLWATQREGVALRIAVVNTGIMVVVSWVLIALFDVVGAAVASVLVGGINVVQHYLPVSRLFERSTTIVFPWKPVVASVVMAGVLMVIAGAPTWIRLTAGVGTYSGAMLALSLFGTGGSAELRRQIQSVRIRG